MSRRDLSIHDELSRNSVGWTPPIKSFGSRALSMKSSDMPEKCHVDNPGFGGSYYVDEYLLPQESDLSEVRYLSEMVTRGNEVRDSRNRDHSVSSEQVPPHPGHASTNVSQHPRQYGIMRQDDTQALPAGDGQDVGVAPRDGGK